MIETAHYVVDTLSQKQGGIYYTPSLAADAMASWAIRSSDERVLEPCFGSGVFLAAIKQVAASRDFPAVQTYGVELMNAAFWTGISTNLIDPDHATLGDFLNVRPFNVDAVVGNPPYVRLRSLPEEQEQGALTVTQEALGAPMASGGSIWMAFVLHAVKFLVKGGRLALVLPYEFTHVRYAKPLWEFLGRHFGDLRVVRVKERLFPDLMQEAVILFADNHGGATTTVSLEAFETTRNLAENIPSIRQEFPIRQVVEGRPFVRALLSAELAELLAHRLGDLTTPVPASCTFNIGYVSGNKGFFHPNEETVEEYDLPQVSLRSTLTASRELTGIGIRTSSIPPHNDRKLFYPNGNLSTAEELYIHKGEVDRVDFGYKCSRRTPWYKVPDVRVPDLFLSVFMETPTLVINDAGLVASNSLLCGFLHPPYTAEQFIAAWYTSLTLLYFELQVHSLGGGVLVAIPGEVANIRVPSPNPLPTGHTKNLDQVLMSSGGNPYEMGDDPVLVNSLGLTIHEVELIQEGVRSLTEWRTACRAS